MQIDLSLLARIIVVRFGGNTATDSSMAGLLFAKLNFALPYIFPGKEIDTETHWPDSRPLWLLIKNLSAFCSALASRHVEQAYSSGFL